MIDEPEEAVPSKTGDPDPAEYANASPFPSDHVIGDGPMSESQASLLQRLCKQAGLDFDPALSAAAASETIDRIRAEIPGLAGLGGGPR